MGGTVGVVIIVVGSVWVASLLTVGLLTLFASRNHPKVIVDDPWDTLPVQRQLDLLRTAVAQARAEQHERREDFERWEQEVRAGRSSTHGTARPRPRPAA